MHVAPLHTGPCVGELNALCKARLPIIICAMYPVPKCMQADVGHEALWAYIADAGPWSEDAPDEDDCWRSVIAAARSMSHTALARYVQCTRCCRHDEAAWIDVINRLWYGNC